MAREGTASVVSVFQATMRNRSLLGFELAWAAFNGPEWDVWVRLLVGLLGDQCILVGAALTGHAPANSAAAGVIARRRDELQSADGGAKGPAGVEGGAL